MTGVDTSTFLIAATVGVLLILGIVLVLTLETNRRSAAMPFWNDLQDAEGRLQRRRTELGEVEERVALLRQKEGEREYMQAEVAALEERIARVRAEHDALSDARGEIRVVQEEAQKALDARGEAQAALNALRIEEEDLRVEATRARADIEGRQAKLDALEDRIGAAREELEPLERRLADLSSEVSRAREAIARATEAEATATRAEARVERTQEVLGELRAQLDELRREQAQLEMKRHEAERLRTEAEAAGLRIAAIQAEEAALQLRIAKLRREAGGTDASAPVDPLRDLSTPPAMLSDHRERIAIEEEAAGLHLVRKALEEEGLTFADRTLKSFHTALKINDAAQLTVLAGVSGTGKSLLPRRYAEAIGMWFLPVAVEPRWDSPQDLLGFHDYIEKKFRAQDLSRLMVQLDPFDTSGLVPGGAHRGEMAIVLLDEMNLARVEYYFSEFLSRLELRPPYGGVGELMRRAPSHIPLDVRGVLDEADKPRQVSLFASHNVLFVGTMNDDESTQSLTDKVLDRSNVMQFAAPPKTGGAGGTAPRPRVGVLHLEEWRRWVRRPLEGQDGRTVDGWIGDAADIMRGIGRPFGHRMADGMRAFVANWPAQTEVDRRHAFAAQVEMRLLPRLRAVEIEGVREHFEKLAALVREKLGDQVLSDALERQIEDQADATGQFSWRGVSRAGA